MMFWPLIFDALCALFTDKSKSCPLNTKVPPPPPPIISLSLSKGATTSGLDDAPGYSPIRPNVGPDIIPPLANFCTPPPPLSPDLAFKDDFKAAPAATAAIPAANATGQERGLLNDNNANFRKSEHYGDRDRICAHCINNGWKTVNNIKI